MFKQLLMTWMLKPQFQMIITVVASIYKLDTMELYVLSVIMVKSVIPINCWFKIISTAIQEPSLQSSSIMSNKESDHARNHDSCLEEDAVIRRSNVRIWTQDYPSYYFTYGWCDQLLEGDRAHCHVTDRISKISRFSRLEDEVMFNKTRDHSDFGVCSTAIRCWEERENAKFRHKGQEYWKALNWLKAFQTSHPEYNSNRIQPVDEPS